jgi:hypothetical protein
MTDTVSRRNEKEKAGSSLGILGQLSETMQPRVREEKRGLLNDPPQLVQQIVRKWLYPSYQATS